MARNSTAAFDWATKARDLHAQIFGADDPEALRFEALAIFAQGCVGDPLEAAGKLDPLIEQQRSLAVPLLARLLWFQGDLYLRGGQFDAAARNLREAESLAATHSDLTFQLPIIRADLGDALLGLGRFDEAVVKLQSALSGAEVPRTPTPAQAQAHAGLALAALKRNDPRAALLEATAADEFWQAFDPENPVRKRAAGVRSQALRAVAMLQEN